MSNPVIATRDYLRNAIAELKKVSWPTREMTIRYSMLVIVISLVTATFFAALDFGLRQGVDVLFARPLSAPLAPAPEPIVPDLEVTPTGIQTEGGEVTVTPESTDVSTEAEGGITLPPIDIAP